MRILERMDVTNKILMLLRSSHKPLSVHEISIYLGERTYLVNLSLGRLLYEEKIIIDSKADRNYFSIAKEPSFAFNVFEEKAVLA